MPSATPAHPAPMPASDDLLEVLFNVSMTGIILFRPVFGADGAEIVDLAYVRLNTAAQQMLQLPERPAQSFLALYPNARPTGVFDFYCRAFQSEAGGQHQLNYQHDGLDAYFYLAAQRSGPLLVVNFTDTNDQPRSAVEDALRQAQARERAARAEAERERAQLNALLTQAPVAIGLFTGDELRVSAINPLMANVLGYEPAQLLGHPLFEQAPELQGQGFDELMRQVQATQVPFVGQEAAAIVKRQGELQNVYFNFVYQPLYDAEGHVSGIINVAVDVTEQVVARRQAERLNDELEARVQERTQVAEQALAEAERQRQRVTDLVEQAPAAMCVVGGPEFTYEAFNPRYAAMFDGRPQVGRTVQEVLSEAANHPVFLLFQAVYAAGRTFRQRETLARLARPGDGVLEDRYFDYTLQPRYDSQGQIDWLFIFAVDVTEQVRARQQVQALNEELAAINEELTATNEELNESNAQLTRTNVDLDTFVYTASHDLKAPITNIESITLALRETLPPEVQQNEMVGHLLDLLGQTTTRFQVTIGQLTDLSKLQLAHAGPAEPVALAAVVEGVRLDLAPLIAAAGVQLTVEVAPELLVSFSPANLRSILYNLLSNAVKYRDPARPAQVWVRATRAGQDVTVQVQDNGLGLSDHQQQRLFGLFQRLHTHVEGTGVGLYITKRLVENGGGTIAVQSRVGVGTTFTVILPT